MVLRDLRSSPSALSASDIIVNRYYFIPPVVEMDGYCPRRLARRTVASYNDKNYLSSDFIVRSVLSTPRYYCIATHATFECIQE